MAAISQTRFSVDDNSSEGIIPISQAPEEIQAIAPKIKAIVEKMSPQLSEIGVELTVMTFILKNKTSEAPPTGSVKVFYRAFSKDDLSGVHLIFDVNRDKV